jgi:glutamate-1-semialdehyde 2,1-aminomutase
VSMAAGASTIRELLSADVLNALFDRGERLRQRLAAIAADSPPPLSVTGLGSMMAIHSVDGPVTSPDDLRSSDPHLKQLLFHELLERGIYMAPRGFIALSVAVTDDDCDVVVSAFEASLTAIAHQ